MDFREQIEGAIGDKNRVVYAEGSYDVREPQCFETRGPEGSLKRKIMSEGTIYYPKLIHQETEPESVCRAVMRRDSHYKLIVRSNGEHELYDMERGPKEYKNLYGDLKYRELFQELALKLLLWLVHTSDVAPHPSKDVKPWYAQSEPEGK